MKIHLVTTKKVLVEKFDIKHEILLEIEKQLKDCERVVHEKFPNRVIFRKFGRYIFEQDTELRTIAVVNTLWNQIGFDYNLNYAQIQQLISTVMSDHLGIEGFVPHVRPDRYFNQYANVVFEEYVAQ